MNDLGFSHAGFLILLPPALALAAAFCYLTVRSYLAARTHYGEPGLVDRFSKRVSLRSQLATVIGWLAVVALILVAAAGPTLPRSPQKVNIGGLQVMTVFDVGQSMNAEDYSNVVSYDKKLAFFGSHGTREDEARNVLANDILPAVVNNEVGIVTFEGKGFSLADPTDDFGYLSYVLDNWVYVGNAPSGDDNLASGLQVALNEFKLYGKPGMDKVIVLFSDGDNDSDPSEYAKVVQELNAMHVRLVIIGLGQTTPVPVPVYDKDGQFSGKYYEVNGQTAYTGLKVDNLESLASATGGQFIHLDPSSLPSINWPSTLASASKVEIKKTELYRYPLSAAFILLVLISLKGSWRTAYARLRKRLSGRS